MHLDAINTGKLDGVSDCLRMKLHVLGDFGFHQQAWRRSWWR